MGRQPQQQRRLHHHQTGRQSVLSLRRALPIILTLIRVDGVSRGLCLPVRDRPLFVLTLLVKQLLLLTVVLLSLLESIVEMISFPNLKTVPFNSTFWTR